MFKSLPLLLSLVLLNACSVEEAQPPPPRQGANAEDPKKYAGQGTVYDTQFKALHDAKQLEKQMNDNAAKLDEQINPEE